MPVRGLVVDRWYLPYGVYNSASSLATYTGWASGEGWAYPLWAMEEDYYIEEVGVSVTTASTRADTLRIGIYDGSTGEPTDLLYEFTNKITWSSGSGMKTTTGSYLLTKHTLYFIVAIWEPAGSGTIATTQRANSSMFPGPYGQPSSYFGTTVVTTGFGLLTVSGLATGSPMPSDLTGTVWVPAPQPGDSAPFAIFYRGYSVPESTGNDGWGWGQGGGQMWQVVLG